MSNLKVYAWSKPGVHNFGDELGPDMLRRLGHTVERVSPSKAEVVVIGSVLHHMEQAPKGCVVAGAGVMHADRPLLNLQHLDIKLTRGDVTNASINWQDDEIRPFVGDPAIIAPEFYQRWMGKRTKVGWVPHYVDGRKIPNADVTIDVLQPPEQVIYEITKCRYILTSSLHALIVAQAFGIPAQRLAHPRVLGADTKWVDYATGYAHADMTSIYNILEGL